jgi:hypothetical protein
VVVSVEHYIDTSSVEDFPKTLHPFLAGTVLPRCEQWVVEVGKGTLLLVVGCEVLLEPLHLGGAGTAADLSLSTVAVECDYVPGPKVVGVVALIGFSSGITEVVEVS